MHNKNVLIFPCGTEIGQELHAALKHEKSVTLFGASSLDDHGRMVFARYFADIPFVSDPDFDAVFEQCLKTNNIDFIIPAHDNALLYLAENREKFSATVIAPKATICRTCRSKSATYHALFGEDFVPTFYESPAEIPKFPVFLKPDQGQGSQGTLLAMDRNQLDAAVCADPTLIICEYLPGKEYTVDCYSNLTGRLLFIGARERIRTKAGISMQSKTVPSGGTLEAAIHDIGTRINQRLKITGPWFFQIKVAVDSSLKLLEVAPRIAGTMALHRIQGINFTLMALFEADGQSVATLGNSFDAEIERALINRYNLSLTYSCLYLDLDDTLIVHEKLNLAIVQLVYQCVKKNVSVKLITRHYRDPSITLAEFKLHAALFDEIIWITDQSVPKSRHMNVKNAIFIDDSFQERRQVASALGITVLAPDSAEALLDWRA